ncbi:hypothetical protein T10_10731 [Trichinella papuae]|uniref:Uncharacterized protein n=1 Tax=Trichinella papuae TaxID=268474 RepID=A0A0V1MN60_9BILA|nr:hypothetical protein T10_10731 [Trichinella papuae]
MKYPVSKKIAYALICDASTLQFCENFKLSPRRFQNIVQLMLLSVMTGNDAPFLFTSADWRNLACSIAIMQIISQLKYLQLNNLSLKMHERYMW